MEKYEPRTGPLPGFDAIRIKVNRFIGKFQAYIQFCVASFPKEKKLVYSTASTEDEVRSVSSEQEDELLWCPPSPRTSQMWDFLTRINTKYGQRFTTYKELHAWSTEQTSDFWREAWDYCGIRHSRPYKQVVDDASRMWPRPTWFKDARLNFAENLLFPPQPVSEDDIAVISVTETQRDSLTWKELRKRVHQCHAAMKAMNIKPGDRVAGYVANHSSALVAMLATTSLGAIWTAVSPDTGVTATLDRLLQIEPCLLFADNAVAYNGKAYPVLPKLRDIVRSLPTLAAAVILQTWHQQEEPGCAELDARVLSFDAFISNGDVSRSMEFAQMPAEHAVFVLYSSGTTGAPKCIVHGAIGTLLQHKKEHVIQSDIRPGDRLLYITTCMWMMWHWCVSGLASGATVVLYNGSPFYYVNGDDAVRDELAMPKMIDELHINQFGASARFFSMLQQNRLMPKDQGMKLSTLKAIYSTGSPLAPSTFRYIYEAFGRVNLASISGGTDIISDFGTPSPLSPVYAGEIQAIALGMAVQSWGPGGHNLTGSGEPGELVCVKPFPSQPVQFWGPDGESKYKASYFDRFPGVWAHGDYVRINPRTGGLVMLGRSDGVLNPSGVRFGSAEIYNLILKKFPETVEDSLCIGRRREGDMDETVILFLKMRRRDSFGPELEAAVKGAIRGELSPRHVPAIVAECPDIPVTANGKKVEVLVKRIMSGPGAALGRRSGTVNEDCLLWYKEWAEKH
ncbi:acetoacetyl-CoA synthase [Metarhizium album ARSEF 1941]|uniref:Acetoacetyl-CoA synthase n=1 Tax=Metarhizium album (strain ARSEF 1941) TaxID=1081103 RepID=A0A0B2WNJ5_METAS|nr:acetoacetyl-CoA synthase [Metarhizium album ARSEF 1941]KHN97626.1 acetoacetyl-CoA synthase [Metarhizium album ARSEF 1941]